MKSKMARGGRSERAGRKSVLSATTKRQQSPAQLANLRIFKPGQSGNPRGRTPGSRNKVSVDFLAAVTADFEQHGPAAIVKMREEKPADSVRMIASLLPKEVYVRNNLFEELTDDELAAGIAVLQALIAAEGTTLIACVTINPGRAERTCARR